MNFLIYVRYSILCKINDIEMISLADLVNASIEDAIKTCTVFFSKLYDRNSKNITNDESIDVIRYDLITKKNVSIEKLPPSKPALKQYILRSKWQINEWMQARFSEIKSFDPLEHGWLLDNGVLLTNYFVGDTAMDLLQKFLCSCTAMSPCSTETCACFAANLKCSPICSCTKKCQRKDNLTNNITNDEEVEAESYE